MELLVREIESTNNNNIQMFVQLRQPLDYSLVTA